MLQGEHLTLTYQDGETTINAVDDVSIRVTGVAVTPTSLGRVKSLFN